jgi:hypothetical protein
MAIAEILYQRSKEDAHRQVGGTVRQHQHQEERGGNEPPAIVNFSHWLVSPQSANSRAASTREDWMRKRDFSIEFGQKVPQDSLFLLAPAINRAHTHPLARNEKPGLASVPADKAYRSTAKMLRARISVLILQSQLRIGRTASRCKVPGPF